MSKPLICPEDKKPCTCATSPKYDGSGCPREKKSKHPFKILAYVNHPDPHVRDSRERILGVRVKDNGDLLSKGVDYVRAVFDHYEQNKTFGGALAMRVLQSDLYHKLDDVERAECDELIRCWLAHHAAPSIIKDNR